MASPVPKWFVFWETDCNAPLSQKVKKKRLGIISKSLYYLHRYLLLIFYVIRMYLFVLEMDFLLVSCQDLLLFFFFMCLERLLLLLFLRVICLGLGAGLDLGLFEAFLFLLLFLWVGVVVSNEGRDLNSGVIVGVVVSNDGRVLVPDVWVVLVVVVVGLVVAVFDSFNVGVLFLPWCILAFGVRAFGVFGIETGTGIFGAGDIRVGDFGIEIGGVLVIPCPRRALLRKISSLLFASRRLLLSSRIFSLRLKHRQW